MKSSHRLFFKKFILDFWVGFVVYAAILAFIFYSYQDRTWAVFFLTLAWTFFWLTFYAEYLTKVSVELYEDHVRKKMFATTEDLKGAVIGTHYCRGKFEKGKNDIDNPSNYAR
ncbi:MAG: hypothetical protein HGA36_03190 [Candidatus Moranbacteria bacterium]|nr:hypothetical protein [Candidatus Moranbacteria bacterium]